MTDLWLDSIKINWIKYNINYPLYININYIGIFQLGDKQYHNVDLFTIYKKSHTIKLYNYTHYNTYNNRKDANLLYYSELDDDNYKKLIYRYNYIQNSHISNYKYGINCTLLNDNEIPLRYKITNIL